MVATLKRVLMKKPQPFMSKVDPQKWNYAAPLNQRLINENYNEFYQIIENSGAEIIELQMIDENEELCDSIFTHDPSLVINEGAIIGAKVDKQPRFILPTLLFVNSLFCPDSLFLITTEPDSPKN